jgi:capsular exopolysaccharide synthesis family protein
MDNMEYQMEPEPETEEEIHLRDYWKIILKYRWFVLSFFIIVVSLGTVWTFMQRPIYRATSTIWIEKEAPKVVSFQEVLSVDTSTTDYYQTQYQILQSQTIARKVIFKLKLYQNPEFALADGVPMDPPKDYNDIDIRIVKAFLSRLSIEPVRNSRIVKINFESYSPELAAQIANTVADVYIEQSLETKTGVSQDAVNWLQKKIVELRKKVEESEMKVQKYKEENQIISIEEKETIIAQQLNELNQQLMDARVKRVEAETRYTNLKRLSKETEMIQSTPEVIGNPFIQSLKAKEVELEREYAEMSEKYGPKHPQLVRLRSQLDEIKHRINLEVRKIINSIKTEYEVAKAREETIMKSFEELKEEAQEFNKKSIEFGVLKRQAESDRQMYEILLKRLNEASIGEDIQAVNVRIVDRAVVQNNPVKPKKLLNTLISIGMGLGLGIALAFFFEYFDNTFRTPEDVENTLVIPFLGIVPDIKLDENEPESMRDLIVQKKTRSTAAEAFRSIRTNLLLSYAERKPDIILVSSPGPYEGKSLVSTNLSLILAQTGERVLLIDGDMRKPRVHKIFGLDDSKGLSTLLTGHSDIKEIILETGVPNLYFIPAGPKPPNPAELLGSGKMTEITQELKKRFEYIIIDSPPLIAVTDSAVLSKIVSGVVIVLKAGQTTKELARRAIKNLKDINAKILGAILNDVDFERDRYYYYYPYYYKYYKHYAGDKEERLEVS